MIKWEAIETHSPQYSIGRCTSKRRALATFNTWWSFLSTRSFVGSINATHFMNYPLISVELFHWARYKFSIIVTSNGLHSCLKLSLSHSTNVIHKLRSLTFLSHKVYPNAMASIIQDGQKITSTRSGFNIVSSPYIIMNGVKMHQCFIVTNTKR